MRRTAATSVPKRPTKRPADPPDAGPSRARKAIAQRVADAHAALDPITVMVFGSTASGSADARSDIDMSVVFEAVPAEADLLAACSRAGGGPWTWRSEPSDDASHAVAFSIEGIEVQVVYTERGLLDAELDTLFVAHDPTTYKHKVAEGLLAAQPLLHAENLRPWQARVAQFPAALGDAMMRHYLAEPTNWRWFSMLLHRDSVLWCRELQVQACYRLIGTLAGLNRQYFCTWQLKRVHRFAARLALAPPHFADRVEELLVTPLPQSLALLFALEGEVLDLVAAHAPQIDLAAVRERRTRWVAAA